VLVPAFMAVAAVSPSGVIIGVFVVITLGAGAAVRLVDRQLARRHEAELKKLDLGYKLAAMSEVPPDTIVSDSVTGLHIHRGRPDSEPSTSAPDEDHLPDVTEQ